MNVLIITTFYPPAKGGIQTYTYQIAKNLKNLGNEVTVFAISSDGIKKIFSSPSLKVYKGNKKSSLLNIFSPYDAIVVTSWFPSAIMGVFLSFFHSSKLYISAHGNELLYPEKSSIMKRSMKFCFDKANKIFAVSTYTKKLLVKKGMDESKIVVVPNGTDPKRFNPDVDFYDLVERYNLRDKKIIFSVSRLVERKNFGIVIEIMPEILKDVPDAVYIIGGTGPMRENWEKMAEEKGVKDKVLFVGYISDDELPKYYAMCDVFVMPSMELEERGEVEGFGIAFLEANACGKPVVGGRSGGIEDAIINGETGFLVNPNSRKEIKETILKILKNLSIAKSMGKKGRERVEKELNWSNITKKLLKEIAENE